MKSFFLTVGSVAIICLLVNLGYYKTWFREKPVEYWKDFKLQVGDTTSANGIRNFRYGIFYTVSMKVKDVVAAKKVVNPVILFEPNSYYRDSLHLPFRAPEPAVFYYFTGLEGVWTNSPRAGKANFLVRVSKQGAVLDDIRSPEQLKKILDFYKKYPPGL